MTFLYIKKLLTNQTKINDDFTVEDEDVVFEKQRINSMQENPTDLLVVKNLTKVVFTFTVSYFKTVSLLSINR